MKLSILIEALKVFPPETKIVFDSGGSPGALNSYRGYYHQLALGSTGIDTSVAKVLDDCIDAVGKTFEGYKGGSFTMNEDTEVVVANYGEYWTTREIMGVAYGGILTSLGPVAVIATRSRLDAADIHRFTTKTSRFVEAIDTLDSICKGTTLSQDDIDDIDAAIERLQQTLAPIRSLVHTSSDADG